MSQHEEDFKPFCELGGGGGGDGPEDYKAYVDRVRSSAEWGGHLELRAISMALQRPIHVYSVTTATAALSGGNRGGGPLVIDDSRHDDDNQDSDISSNNSNNPIRLSYHLKYYALGEHYNHVVPVK